MAKGAVILAFAGFQISGKLPGLIIIKGPGRKINCKINHILCIGTVRPHDAGIIKKLPIPGGIQCQDEKVFLILCQKVLDRKRGRDTSLSLIPRIYLGPFHKTSQIHTADFILDPLDAAFII